MKHIALLLCVLAVAACTMPATAPIGTAGMTPDAAIASQLPVDAYLMIYITREDTEKNVVLTYGPGERVLHAAGEDLRDAALAVAKDYFTTVTPHVLNGTSHFVLRLSGDAFTETAPDRYMTVLRSALYAPNGALINKATTYGSERYVGVVDKKAYYRAYARATHAVLKKIWDFDADVVTAAVGTPPQQPASAKMAHRNKLEVMGTGSGFYINSTGHIVTNEHVVSQCLALSASRDGVETDVTLVHADAQSDIAVLKSTAPSGEHAVIAARGNAVRLGEDIVTIGFPLSGVLSSGASLTKGNISAMRGLNNDARLLQTTAPIQPGNSGGPLLDRRGHIVGVVKSKLNALRLAEVTGDIAQNVNFAVKAPELIHVLNDSGVGYDLSDQAVNDDALSTSDIADRATRYTVQVTCRG